MKFMMLRAVTLVIVALLAAPVAAGAQGKTEKTFRLGFLANVPPTTPETARNYDAFFQGLRDLGYVEGQNLTVERRYAEGRPERWPVLATELVGLKPDVIVVNTTPAALAVKKASDTIPIVIPSAIDPVGAGLAASLARPGGTVTGLTLLSPEVSARALALLKEAVPGISRLAVLWNAANPANASVWKATESAAQAMGLTLQPQHVGSADDLEKVFAAIAKERPDGLIILSDALIFPYRARIVAFATEKRLPSVVQSRAFGGLMSYGPSVPDMYRRGASYVDRILKGAKPGELPIEQPPKTELVINLKTAKALGLTMPASLLQQADQVIE